MKDEKRKAKYDIEYAKKNLKRIPLDVPKPDYDTIKAHAEAHSESVNGFIKRAISQTMERDSAAPGASENDPEGEGNDRH